MFSISSKYTLLLAIMFAVQLCAGNKVLAQEVVISETPVKKDAIFKTDSVIAYDIEMQNKYANTQQGTLKYVIKTPHGRSIGEGSMPVTLTGNHTNTVHLEMPGQKSGFYKVSFIVNLTDYDDTIRRVFGVDIHKIRSVHPKPIDFKQFWSAAKAQLAQVAPRFKVTEKPEMAQPDYNVYQIEMKSLGNVTVRGWLTMPKDKLPQEKLPVYFVLPGYGAELAPIPGVPHFASIALNVRGLGNSRDEIAPAHDDFITYNIEDRNKYIMRGVIMDCERMIDFIVSNKDLDAKAICVTGGSMGAYLSYALAGLDPRVTLVLADNPTFSDWRWEVGYNSFPITNIERYAKTHHLPLERVLKTLDYFDLKNFMPTVKAKSIMAIGLLDNFAPPNTEMVAYNALPGDKQMFIYSNLGHEIDQSLGNFKGKWLYANFHMFDRVMALTEKPGGDLAGTDPNDHAVATTDGKGRPAKAILTGQTDLDGTVSNPKFNTNPVGLEAKAGARNSSFKKNSTIYYELDLKNNQNSPQRGTVTCEVTTKDGEHISVTTAAINLAAGASDKLRMNLPIQRGGYFKATFILKVDGFEDKITRYFGVDTGNLKPGDGDGVITMTAHPGAKDGMFPGKGIVYYNVDVKNNFDIQQEGMLGCEVRTMNNKFLSFTSVAVRLPAGSSSTVRINLPTQKRGQYRANFIINTPKYNDTLKATFSVDTNEVSAKPEAQHTNEDETISVVEHPGHKDATFKSNGNIYYDLDLKNNFNTMQSGKLSCELSTMNGKVLSLTSVAVNLRGKEKKQVRMNIPSQSAGFYKVNFMINSNDYDDTVRRVLGVDISKITSSNPKPANFEEFWDNAKRELATVDPHFKMIEKPELSRGNDQVYLIEMQSIGNLTVRGWLTLPKDRRSNQKFPVYLALPGYGADQKPFHNMPDFAAIALNVRGQGNSNDVLNIGREEFLTYNILDKNKYILRGAIMDCIRAVDFIFSRPEFDQKSIYSNGGSMGGYLSLILASLDHRINVCTAGNPAFSDWRALVDHNDFPMGSIQRYARENNLNLNKILDNLDYFDLKNFVSAIKCKTLVGIGLLDNLAPPHTEMPAYNSIQAEKKIFIFPNLGHQVGDEFGSFTGKLVYDNFGIF